MERLNEAKLNLFGKLLLASIILWAQGKQTNLKIRGTKEQITSATRLMLAIKHLNKVLDKKDVTVSEILAALSKKNEYLNDLQSVFGTQFYK